MTSLIHIDNHAKINTVAEMDYAAKQHVSANWKVLSDTDRKVLDVIRKYSSIYRAAKLLVRTIAGLVGKAEITVRRALSKLVSLKIIERIKTKRPVNAGQGANIYVILPFTENDMPKPTPPKRTGKLTDTPSQKVEIEKDPLSLLFKPSLTSETGNSDLLKEALVNKISKPIAKILKPFFNANEMYEIYGTICKAKSSVDRLVMFEEHEHVFRRAILSAIEGLKHGRVTNFHGYLYRTIQRTTRSIIAPVWTLEPVYTYESVSPDEREQPTMDGYINAMFGDESL